MINFLVFIQTIDQSIEESLMKFKDLISIMTNSSNATFIKVGGESEDILNGCAFTTLSDKCKLFILLRVTILN